MGKYQQYLIKLYSIYVLLILFLSNVVRYLHTNYISMAAVKKIFKLLDSHAERFKSIFFFTC
jgi:hypothetical protein